MGRPVSEQREIQAALDQIRPLTIQGKYKAALGVAERALRQFPSEAILQYQYAKLLGDFADELPLTQKKKLKKKSVGILKPLLRRLRGFPGPVRFGICLNYYYQTEKFHAMFAYGKRLHKTDKKNGLYALALGAGLVSFELHQAGRRERAKNWALKSVAAWKKYPLAREKYYFAHYSYAKALALAGSKKEAHRRLKVASRWSGRPVSDWEFADVVKLLDG